LKKLNAAQNRERPYYYLAFKRVQININQKPFDTLILEKLKESFQEHMGMV
jgi:hypothetical protein